MKFDELDNFFTKDLGLVTDPKERGAGKTYFFKRVRWLPSETTRVIRVLSGTSGEVILIQLCVSSDNNNSVLVKPPYEFDVLKNLVVAEISMLKSKRQFDSSSDTNTA
jgi:hypothetical protein